MRLNVLELFCGAGSFSVAMDTLGIEHEIVGFSDIRDTAIDLFCRIHNKKPTENLGDIKNVSGIGLDVDLLVFGSPCQSFTREGRGDGGEKGSNTKSSLMWEAVRIMGECNPKWIIWENVPDAINKKHMKNFEDYMQVLDELNYNTYYTILNAHELGSPQKRKRLFSVSIRKDIDNGNFKFLYDKIEPNKLSEYLDNDFDEKFIAEDKVKDSLLLGKSPEGYVIRNGTKLGYLIAQEGDAIDLGFYSSKTRRGRVQKDACQTLLRSKTIGTIQNGTLRYLTPFEYWKLQEMPIELYSHVKDCNFSLNDEYDVVGGVINQLHLKVVFNSLRNAFGW